LAYRDELLSLLKTLDKEEDAAARGFYQTAWSGLAGYTFDRIGRGTTHIEAVCVGLLGSIQPEKLAEYIRSGACDDGMMQRFNLLVWPDDSPEWRPQDRYADTELKTAAYRAFDRLDTLDWRAVGAEIGNYDPLPFVRFTEEARERFVEWRTDLEREVRGDELSSSALEGHFAKYRKLIPALALINHFAGGSTGPVGKEALLRALALAEYLRGHAFRAYSPGRSLAVPQAKAILSHIRKGDLKDGFTPRDVYRGCWAGLDNGSSCSRISGGSSPAR
jgi:Protein of unknown function (DUF3987)